MEIDGASILVTGGCGMIGSTTIDLLLTRFAPARVVILDNLVRGAIDNLQDALQDPRVTLMCCDIRDANSVRKASQGMDAVIHMAALPVDACSSDTREAFDVMCEGSFNVVDAAHLAGVKRVVAASSASIYGFAGAHPTPEDHHPYGDQTWYGASKVMLEGLLRSYHAMFGLPYVALRYGEVYGPRMGIEGDDVDVLIKWMTCIADGRPPVIPGDGSRTRDFVYVDDVARANVLSLQVDVVDEVFNIAGGIETSLSELAQALSDAMGLELPPEYGPEIEAGPVRRRSAATDKAKQLLGFNAQVDLREGLVRLVDWWHSEHAARVRPLRRTRQSQRRASMSGR